MPGQEVVVTIESSYGRDEAYEVVNASIADYNAEFVG
jgi:hypothetical protein